MTPEEWRKRYIERFVQKADWTYRKASDIYFAGRPWHDYTDSPEDAADEEMEYWREEN